MAVVTSLNLINTQEINDSDSNIPFHLGACYKHTHMDIASKICMLSILLVLLNLHIHRKSHMQVCSLSLLFFFPLTKLYACYDINKECTYSFPTYSLHLTFISFPGTFLFLTVLKFHKIQMLCNLFEYNLFMENQIFPLLTTQKKDPETNVLIVTSLSSGVYFSVW